MFQKLKNNGRRRKVRNNHKKNTINTLQLLSLSLSLSHSLVLSLILHFLLYLSFPNLSSFPTYFSLSLVNWFGLTLIFKSFYHFCIFDQTAWLLLACFFVLFFGERLPICLKIWNGPVSYFFLLLVLRKSILWFYLIKLLFTGGWERYIVIRLWCQKMKQQKQRIALTQNGAKKRNLALFYLSYLLSSRYNNRRSLTYLSVSSLLSRLLLRSVAAFAVCSIHQASGFWVLCFFRFSVEGKAGGLYFNLVCVH